MEQKKNGWWNCKMRQQQDIHLVDGFEVLYLELQVF